VASAVVGLLLLAYRSQAQGVLLILLISFVVVTYGTWRGWNCGTVARKLLHSRQNEEIGCIVNAGSFSAEVSLGS
jgi:hypothetical protein